MVVNIIIYTMILVWRELVLFAAFGFLLGGLDELSVDLIWIARKLWRHVFIYTRYSRASAELLGAPKAPGLIAIFIAAWDEANVIDAMLRYTIATLDHAHYRIYLGCYPNDQATIAAARTVDDPRLRIVIGQHNGPTTKADCLNTLWRTLVADEVRDGMRAKAIVLHDAEDVVHAQELALFDRLIERFALVQLPVLPLINPASPWISGHYCDEFAEAHGKALVVREALGAAIPAAGVGCAFARDMIAKVADAQNGRPFDAQSLTEDYELGLKIGALGGRGVLVRLPSGQGVVQVTAYFPATLSAAVRQKARWINGIALAGYDRLGWRGNVAERWMRLRDRRALLTAVLLCAGYTAIILTFLLGALHVLISTPLPHLLPIATGLIEINAVLLFWRLCVRASFVSSRYGWREGMKSIPRMMIANVITVMAAWRAVFSYLEMRRTGFTHWEKTSHVFPGEMLTG